MLGTIFGDNKFELDVIDSRSLDGYSNDGKITTGVYYQVFTAGSQTLATIYADEVRTSKTNPVTRTQFASDGGKIIFWGSAASYDIVVYCQDGSWAKLTSVTPRMHTIPVDTQTTAKLFVIPFSASDNTETDTSFDLPYETLIDDVRIFVRGTDATETIDIGLLSSETAGDADGFLVGASVATSGWVDPTTVTVGSNERYLSACTYGALMGSFLAGADVAGDVGTFIKKGHMVTGSNAVSVTYTGSSGSDTAAGDIYLFGRRLR